MSAESIRRKRQEERTDPLRVPVPWEQGDVIQWNTVNGTAKGIVARQEEGEPLYVFMENGKTLPAASLRSEGVTKIGKVKI